MDPELTNSWDLLQRRLALMRQLASSLEQVQTAVVRSDLCGIDGHTVRQRELCEALGQLEAEALGQSFLRSTRSSIPSASGKGNTGTGNDEQNDKNNDKAGMLWGDAAVSPEIRQRWESLALQLNQAESRVNQLNKVYAALLRRAQRTLQIFMRVVASPENTYSAPKGVHVMAPSTMQEGSHV
jgi:hypothetical protein